MSKAYDPGDCTFKFGSYKGKKISEVFKTDPGYILWARDNIAPPTSHYIADFIRQENQRIISKKTKS